MFEVTDRVEGRIPGEADSEKICVQFSWGVLSGSTEKTWESESSTSRGRSQAVMQLVPCELMRPFRVNSNYGKEARA